MIGALIFVALAVGLLIWLMASELNRWGRVVFAGSFAAVLSLCGITITQTMGWPKAVSLAWEERNTEKATVLAVSLKEDEAIYLWLELDGDDTPRAYSLPWSMDLADKLQKAMRQAQEQGTNVEMQTPFDDDLEPIDGIFHVAPQHASPPKDVLEPATTYTR